MISTGAITEVIKVLQAIKFARDEQDIIMKRINLMLSTLSESYQQSIDYYLLNNNSDKAGQNNSIFVFYQSLKDASKKIQKVKGRNCCTRYLNAESDLKVLQQSYQLIEDGVKMMQAEKDMIQLSLAKQEIGVKNSQMNTLKMKVKCELGKEFWINHIGVDKVQEPVFDFANKFYMTEMSKIEECKQMKKQYAIAKLLEKMDSDGSGYIDLEEANEFFSKVWSNIDNKKKLVQEILEDQEQPLRNNLQIMISILEESGLERLITKFMAMKMDSRSFLSCDYNSLKQLASSDQSVKIHDCIISYKDYQQRFHDIKDFLVKVRPQAFELLEKYQKNPQKWEPGYTGICRVEGTEHCGELIIQSVKGICTGPYVVLQNENFDYCLMYGFILYFNPEKTKKSYNYYESVFYNSDAYFCNTMKTVEQYSYFDRSEIWSYNQLDPFTRSYAKETLLKNDGNGQHYNFQHGPKILCDNKGAQVRMYYYFGDEVSYQDYCRLIAGKPYLYGYSQIQFV